ncbi:MAG: preprotein translocase subunit SecG [Candidatus Scalinduaceae bacterium]
MKLKWITSIVIIFGLLTVFFIFQWSVVLKTLLILLSVVLIGLVLLQAGRGGGLAAIGGLTDQTTFGTRSSTLLSKLTYLVGAAFIFTTILLTKLTLISIHGTGTSKFLDEATHIHEDVGHTHEPTQGIVEDEGSNAMSKAAATRQKKVSKEKEHKPKTAENSQDNHE